MAGCDFDKAGQENLHEQLRDEAFFPRSLVIDEFDEIRLKEDETILRRLDEPTLYHLSFDKDAEAIRLLLCN